jgi:hypothetical protein
MRTRAEIMNIKNTLYKEIVEGIDTYVENNESKVQRLKENKSVEEGMQIASELLGGLESIVQAPVVKDVCLPPFIAKIETHNTDKLTSFTLTVRSKIKAIVKCKQEKYIYVTDRVLIDMALFMLEVLFNMYLDEMALENINALNTRVAQICVEADIPQRIWFTLSNDSSIINKIDDTKVVFNANREIALDIQRNSIFSAGDSYNDLVCKTAEEKFVALLKTCETTPQILKGNIDLIREVTGLATKKRASKLIRETYHRNVNALLKLREGIGYYEEVVEIDGIETKVFALVKKDGETGEYSVVLKPFDEVSLFNVDYDVLKAIGVA